MKHRPFNPDRWRDRFTSRRTGGGWFWRQAAKAADPTISDDPACADIDREPPAKEASYSLEPGKISEEKEQR